jgi:hypothetical protein
MAKVIALKHHAVTAKLADLFGGIGAADYIEGFDSGQPGKRDESLRKSSKPVGKTRQPDAQIDPAHSSLDPATFDSALGVKGQYKDGVYKFGVGRTTRMGDVEIGNQMGVNTWGTFAGSDDNAVVDGDFAMRES